MATAHSMETGASPAEPRASRLSAFVRATVRGSRRIAYIRCYSPSAHLFGVYVKKLRADVLCRNVAEECGHMPECPSNRKMACLNERYEINARLGQGGCVHWLRLARTTRKASGAGGQCVAFLARDMVVNKVVAVRLPRSSKYTRAIEREVKLLRDIQHTNIVNVRRWHLPVARVMASGVRRSSNTFRLRRGRTRTTQRAASSMPPWWRSSEGGPCWTSSTKGHWQ